LTKKLVDKKVGGHQELVNKRVGGQKSWWAEDVG
jgi:hypothetical protein